VKFQLGWLEVVKPNSDLKFVTPATRYAIIYSGYRCNEVHLNQLSRLDKFFSHRFTVPRNSASRWIPEVLAGSRVLA